ncbi:palmdelphin isoform X4 [Siniperca chuatsi]|uniref:palmdelphin isoform X4 n=1 Tax=Siniperca chuatsi TaxID=119488 RepID=UPI001CE0647D|nr:palmdelphin isoform X4 [Siniperca chuatsi]
MEEADLLKERLQAITNKRRIQENIAKKRRQIEEEKLKLQYIKKKALREQWLMDGLSQQSEEEQEAMRLQAHDEQQQSDQLQSNILSIEKEIEALETQELNISANEEVVLKRLKEVERTAEDIIKELNAEFQADIPSFIPLTPAKNPPIRESGSEEPKKGSSRPSTPRTPNKTPRQTPTPSPSPFQRAFTSRDGAQILREENQRSQDLERQKTPSLIQQDSLSRVQRPEEETKLPYIHIPRQSKSDRLFGAKTPRELTNSKTDVNSPNPAALVSVKARSEGMPAPIQLVYSAVDSSSPSLASHKFEVDSDALIESSGDFNRYSPFCAESIAPLNLASTLPEELESESVTMIFMGYENAEDEAEEDIQAELVIIGNSDDDEDEAQYVKNESKGEECLSYHPEGYKSKVFQPKVGIAKVTGCRDIIEHAYTKWDDLGLHKPTFIHKPGKHSPYLQEQGVDESENTGSINMEKMKLCSTGR